MIEVVSIGDKLIPGRYRVHSRFSRVANFSCGDSMAALVADEIGGGPINIVLRGMDFGTVQSLEITESFLLLDEYEINHDDRNTYDSNLNLSNVDYSTLISNLSVLQNALIKYSSPKSLAFLFTPDRKEYFKSSFEKEFVRRIEAGIDLLFGSEYIAGVRLLRGVGFGLTPGGDDFIAGSLMAFRIASKFLGRDISNRISEIYEAALGNNLISNTFLKCALEGSLSRRQMGLVNALFHFDGEKISRSTRDLMEVGETSGADWGIGFLMTLKYVCN